MNLIEIAHPAGALDAADRAALAKEVTDGLTGDAMTAEKEVPEATLRRARRMTHVGFRELAGWHTGDGPWDASTPPPLWITMSVPEAWRDEMARHVIGWLRRAVRRLDHEHGWERPGGDLWINLVGVADHSIGLNGRPATSDDVLSYLTEEFRAEYDAGAVELPEGVVIDPMCGMRVKLGPRAITLEHDGETVGFCAVSCRAAYARREGLSVPT
jgi:hypothetical protein